MRNIPLNNLAYPVLIKLGNGSSGSGFQINTGEKLFLVTAKHVLFDNNGKLLSDTCELTCQTSDHNDDTETIFLVNLKALNATNNLLFHPDKDVAALMIGETKEGEKDKNITFKMSKSISLKNLGKSNPVSVFKKNIRMLEDIIIGNDIYLYGYPSSLGLQNTPQFNYNKPLLKKGIVSNVNKDLGTIILDCAVYPGNSGGPVVQIFDINGKAAHFVIGVVSQFIPYVTKKNGSNNIDFANSGYSVVVAMNYVFEMLSIKK